MIFAAKALVLAGLFAQSTLSLSATTCLAVEIIVQERPLTAALSAAANRYSTKVYKTNRITLRATRSVIAKAELKYLESRNILSPAVASVVRNASAKFVSEREYPVTRRNTTDEDSGYDYFGNEPEREYLVLPSEERPTDAELAAYLDELMEPL